MFGVVDWDADVDDDNPAVDFGVFCSCPDDELRVVGRACVSWSASAAAVQREEREQCML